MILILTSALLLLLLLSSSLGEPTNVTNPNYLACKDPTKFSCGGTNYSISFPFWVQGMDSRCSYPGFHLNCSLNHSKLTVDIGSIDGYYQIKDIDYSSRVLTVVDLVKVQCPTFFRNTTLDLTLFEFADSDANLTVGINCPLDLLLSVEYGRTLRRIPCQIGNNSFYSVEEQADGFWEQYNVNCDAAVIQMNRIAVDSLEGGDLEFISALEMGFGVTWLVGKDWCAGCAESGGACGYDPDTPSDRTCFCPNSNSTNGSCRIENKTHTKLIAAVVCVGATGFITASLLCFFCFRLKKKRQNSISNSLINSTIHFRSNPEKGRRIESFLEKYGSISPKRYTYLEVKKMTKSFGEKLGKGGCGVVYKGSLVDGHPVAVKVLDDTKTDDGEDFINEIASIGRTSHVNVVSLLGFCYEGSKRALVYDFMPNGSLDRFISPKMSEATITPLGWENLFKIVVGIARGLEYLHRGCNTRIVHFDIKPHNILLDQDLCPKISDFGLAKLCRPKESVISMCGARGTAGYIAPEVFSRNFGVVSSKSDVYSYGMMVLEMVGGREKKTTAVAGDGSQSEVYFPHWIYKHLDRDGGELRDWCGVTSETEGVARKMILVGLWCIQTRPDDRPSISRVLEMLEGSIGGLEMPPEPYLSSPVRTPISSLSVSLLD